MLVPDYGIHGNIDGVATNENVASTGTGTNIQG